MSGASRESRGERRREAGRTRGLRRALWIPALLLPALLMASPALAQAGSYLVRRGDTIASIARRHHVSARALRRANRMSDDTIHPGDRLRIPRRGGTVGGGESGPWQHRVEPGDTLVRLAMRYRVRSRDIRLANRLRGTQLRVGEVLIIPRPGQNPRRARASAGLAVPAPPEVREAEARALSHARAHTHNLGSLHVGQRLLLEAPQPLWLAAARQVDEDQEEVPAAASSPEEAAARAAARDREQAQAAQAEPSQAQAQPEPSQAEQAQPEQAQPEPSQAEPSQPEQTQPVSVTPGAQAQGAGAGTRGGGARAGSADVEGTLLLPVEGGTFIRGWGSGSNGYHLAIDIRANPGTPTLAAERGVVAYAGDGIRGYGNMVILVHPNGLVTAYAHHQRNLVVAGQLVSRGEQIGEVGMTGYARGPHLHFMLVHNGEHCDPVPLFRPRIRYATGRLVQGGQATWYRRRPSGVQCLPRSARPNRRYQRQREREQLRRQRRQRRRRRRQTQAQNG